jgi:hypothetical protein
MANKAPDYTNVIGSDAMQEYLDAQKNARDKYDERNNRLFDPTMLAMAQGFLAPTKTGSFGESLGNVAAAVGPAQSAEEKRTMEMAKMRLDMAQQGVQTEIQTKQAQARQQAINQDLGTDSPYYKAPAAAPAIAPQPVPAPPAGALPSGTQPPAGAPAVAPAPLSVAQTSPVRDAMPPPTTGQVPAVKGPLTQASQAPPAPSAPPVASAPSGTQLFPAQPDEFTPQEKQDYRRGLAAGKDPYEIRKDILENRRKNIQVNQAGTSAVNLLTGQRHGFDPTPTKTFIHGYGSVEIPATYATMLGNAKDAEDYAKIAKMIMFGPQPTAPAPSAPNATPTGKAPAGAPAQRPTAAQAEADAAALKAEKEADAKARGKRTELAIDKLDPAIEVRAVAETAKNLVNQEGGNLVVGIFEKPTISSIMGKMVDEGKFTPVGFRDALVAANVAFTVDQKPNETSQQYTDRKQAILDRYYQMGTQVARAKFEASTLAKGQGAFSDGERRMFADTTISTKMSVSSMNKTADMLIARANFAESIGEKLLGKEMSYDKFRITPEYKSMLKAYEARLQSIWSGKPSSSNPKPSLPSANANAERQGI